jgi:hypothetical protein
MSNILHLEFILNMKRRNPLVLMASVRVAGLADHFKL